jgi:hypothetical protein
MARQTTRLEPRNRHHQARVGNDRQQCVVHLLTCRAHFGPASPPCRATPLVAGVWRFGRGAPLYAASAPQFALSGFLAASELNRAASGSRGLVNA